MRVKVSGGKKTAKQDKKFSLKGKSILVVDDDEVCLLGLSRLLKPLGVKVTLAGSGHECLQILKKKEKYDLLLLDVMMPDMDGWDVAETIREDSKNYLAIRILFMTGIVDYGQARWLNSSHWEHDRIFSKTCSPEELVDAIRSILSAKRSKRMDPFEADHRKRIMGMVSSSVSSSTS